VSPRRIDREATEITMATATRTATTRATEAQRSRDTVRVRPARSDDLPELAALIERCSPETLYRRFHGAAHEPVRREVERVAEPSARHRSWVAVGSGGAVHGIGTLAWTPDGRPEVAVLVEDAWFRQGIGRALLGRAADEARRCGFASVSAWIQADNLRAVRFVRAVAPGVRLAFDSGELAVSVPVGRDRPGAGPQRRDAA
jgi:GNAT superfamily N-acetyltransferase